MKDSMSISELSQRMAGLERTLEKSGVLSKDILDEIRAISGGVVSASIGYSELVENLKDSLVGLTDSRQVYLFRKGDIDSYEKFDGRVELVPESVVDEVLDMEIRDIAEMTARSRSTLVREGFKYVGEIFDRFTPLYLDGGRDVDSFLLGLYRSGPKTVKEIREVLDHVGAPFFEKGFLVGYVPPTERE